MSVEHIIRDFHATTANQSPEEEKIRILKAAAAIIRKDIKDAQCRFNMNKEEYNVFPFLESEDDSLSFVPVSLQILMGDIMVAKGSKNKIASLGQAIMQAAFPRTIIAPLQVIIICMKSFLDY